MIEAEAFIRAAQARGFGLYAGVPCSYLKPFINTVIDSQDLAYIGTANEGDAVAVAAGSAMAGQPAVAMFQNSGLGNAVNPLTSLVHTFKVPVLIIVTLRGEPGGPSDEPQHELMGAITTQMLELMEIDWAYFPEESVDIEPSLDRALAVQDLSALLRVRSRTQHCLQPSGWWILPGASRTQTQRRELLECFGSPTHS